MYMKTIIADKDLRTIRSFEAGPLDMVMVLRHLQ